MFITLWSRLRRRAPAHFYAARSVRRLHVESLEERTAPATFTTTPVSFSGALIQRLDSVLATTIIPGSTLRTVFEPELAVLERAAATLSAADQRELASLLPQLAALTTLPAIDARSLVSINAQFIHFLKDKPVLKGMLDDVLSRIPVESNFLVPVLSGFNAAADGLDAGALSGSLPQQDFILTHPFVSARFLALLAEEASGTFADAGPVSINFSGVSEQIRQPGEVNDFLLVAPQTGQLMVQLDSPSVAPLEGEGLSATVSVFDSTGQLVESSVTGTAGVGVLALDVQAGQRYSIEVAGDGAGQYNLLLALAFGEPSGGTGTARTSPAALTAEQQAPAALRYLSVGGFGVVATLTPPGAGGSPVEERSPPDRAAALIGGGAAGQDEAPAVSSADGQAALRSALDEALGRSRGLAGDDLPDDAPPRRPESRPDAGAPPMSLSVPEVRPQHAVQTVFPIDADAAPMGRRASSPSPQPAGALDEEAAVQLRDPFTPRPAPAENRREGDRTWEASQTFALALLGAGSLRPERAADPDAERLSRRRRR